MDWIAAATIIAVLIGAVFCMIMIRDGWKHEMEVENRKTQRWLDSMNEEGDVPPKYTIEDL